MWLLLFLLFGFFASACSMNMTSVTTHQHFYADFCRMSKLCFPKLPLQWTIHPFGLLIFHNMKESMICPYKILAFRKVWIKTIDCGYNSQITLSRDPTSLLLLALSLAEAINYGISPSILVENKLFGFFAFAKKALPNVYLSSGVKALMSDSTVTLSKLAALTYFHLKNKCLLHY